MKIIECVPNFSVGNNRDIVETLLQESRRQNGIKFLDHHFDTDHGRLVITYIGSPEGITATTFSLAALAVKKIDIRKHQGIHPWFGAVDVIPFIPIKAQMSDCIMLAQKVGRQIAEKFRVPVYFYGEAATKPEREDLSYVRKNGRTGKLEPDYGDSKWHPTAGAVAIGARDFLIAYNINLETSNLEIAKAIASKIRWKNNGLPGVKALGVPLKSRGIVQVTMNITDIQKTSLKQVFDAVRKEAERLKTAILESEIVGLIPQAAVFPGMKEYLKLQDFDASRILESHLGEELR